MRRYSRFWAGDGVADDALKVPIEIEWTLAVQRSSVHLENVILPLVRHTVARLERIAEMVQRERTASLTVGRGHVGSAQLGEESYMEVADICSNGTVHIPMSCTLQEALKQMRDRHVGALAGTEGGKSGRVIAVITDRDIVLGRDARH